MVDGTESKSREAEPGSSRRWRVDEALVERLAGATTEELPQILETGTAEEKRQAAIELGDRGEERAFGPLVKLLSCTDTSVGEGAALGLEWLDDPRAVQPILDAIQLRSRRGELSTVLVFAVTQLDPRRAVWNLAELVQ